MLTNTRMVLEFGAEHVEPADDWLAQSFQRAIKRAGQLRCGVTGHNLLIHHAPNRLSLQCTTCGYESPGWELESARRLERKIGSHVAA